MKGVLKIIVAPFWKLHLQPDDKVSDKRHVADGRGLSSD